MLHIESAVSADSTTYPDKLCLQPAQDSVITPCGIWALEGRSRMLCPERSASPGGRTLQDPRVALGLLPPRWWLNRGCQASQSPKAAVIETGSIPRKTQRYGNCRVLPGPWSPPGEARQGWRSPSETRPGAYHSREGRSWLLGMKRRWPHPLSNFSESETAFLQAISPLVNTPCSPGSLSDGM